MEKHVDVTKVKAAHATHCPDVNWLLNCATWTGPRVVTRNFTCSHCPRALIGSMGEGQDMTRVVRLEKLDRNFV